MPKKPKDDVNALLRKRKELQMELFAIESELAIKGVAEEPSLPTGRQRPLRALTLDALEDLGWPAYSREVMLYLRARNGRQVSPTRFGTLASDEMAAYDKRLRREATDHTDEAGRRA